MSTELKLRKYQEIGLALLVDDSSEQKRIAFVAPAHSFSAEQAAVILNNSGGHFFVAMSESRCESFMIPPMAGAGSSQSHRTHEGDSFLSEATVSVEAREGVTTGISASDRATTVRALASEHPSPRSIIKPGHVFPVRVRDGGLLVKNSLAEAARDLCILSEQRDVALFCEALNEKGEYLSEKDQVRLARDLGIPLFTISELISFRIHNEQIVKRVVETKLPTRIAGQLRALVYESQLHGTTHLALVKGEIDSEKPVLTRVQSEFTVGDIFATRNPPSRLAIDQSLARIAERGVGVLLYLRKPESGQLQLQISDWESGTTRPNASTMREYGLGAQILRDIGVRKVELLTRSSHNLVGLKPFGIEIVEQHALG